MIPKHNVGKKGQTLLMLLVFCIIGITITSAATILVLTNSSNVQKIEGGTLAQEIAESGIENALLRLLRNPNYTGETNLAVGDGSVDITVSGTNPYTITASGRYGNFRRTIQVVVNYTDKMRLSSWKEIF